MEKQNSDLPANAELQDGMRNELYNLRTENKHLKKLVEMGEELVSEAGNHLTKIKIENTTLQNQLDKAKELLKRCLCNCPCGGAANIEHAQSCFLKQCELLLKELED